MEERVYIYIIIYIIHTVDGRTPAPVDMVNICTVNIPLFTGFFTCQVVVWDFFHPQYFYIKPPVAVFLPPQKSETPTSTSSAKDVLLEVRING